MRRRMMYNKRLIEVIEELTRSGTWTAPPGCYTVDAFLVGGGGGGSCYVNGASQPSGEANGGGGAWSVSLNSYDISGGSGIIILRYKRYE